MRVVLQRVSQASVSIEGGEAISMGKGLVLFIGIARNDEPKEAIKLARKVRTLRVFNDEKGKINQSIDDIDGDILVISQFTLLADTSRGTRPSLHHAAAPEKAFSLYNAFIRTLEEEGKRPILTGQFGASMRVMLCNEGPFTLVVDSKKNKEETGELYTKGS